MQTATITQGSGNRIIQIVGDGNTVVASQPHLVLTRYIQRQRKQQLEELDWLSPYTRKAPLIGRQREMEGLRTFMRTPAPLAVRVLIGDGGMGKTRLGLTLCDELSSQGWDAGFADRWEIHRFFSQQNLSTWGWQRPTLVVMDYAAEHAEPLAKWLDELANRDNPHPSPPLRLLLLERHASTQGGWWSTVFNSGGFGASDKRGLLDPPEPVTVPPLSAVTERVAVLNGLLAQLHATNGGPRLAVQEDSPDIAGQLAQREWSGDPLYLLMAAMVMHMTGNIQALSLSRTDLADKLANRELQRLDRLAKAHGLDSLLVQHLAACVTLAQGVTRADFLPFAGHEKAAIHRASNDAGKLADMLEEALPDPAGIARVLPDLIGEALVLRALRPTESGQTVLRCRQAFGDAVTVTAVRCAQDFSMAQGYSTEAPVLWLKAILGALGQDLYALNAFQERLPQESVPLRDLNVDVAVRRVRLLKTSTDAPRHRMAGAHASLAIAMSLAGRPDRALSPAKTAVREFRQVAKEENGSSFRPYLAGSLITLANVLNSMHQPKPALDAALEGSRIYRDLADAAPNIFRPDLATSLNNLSILFSIMGELEPALQTSSEAVDILRELAFVHPDVFRPYLAKSLSTLANSLSDVDQPNLALQAAQESIDIYRDLSAVRPDVFRHSLASSLNTLSGILSDADKLESALEATYEAVDIYRDLAAIRSEVFLPNLAGSLNNLANRLGVMNQHGPAFQAARECVAIYRDLAASRADVFRPDLARSLAALALVLEMTEGGTEAIPPMREAIEILTPAFRQAPPAYKRMMRAMVWHYMRLCSNTDTETDTKVLRPLLPYFTKDDALKE